MCFQSLLKRALTTQLGASPPPQLRSAAASAPGGKPPQSLLPRPTVVTSSPALVANCGTIPEYRVRRPRATAAGATDLRFIPLFLPLSTGWRNHRQPVAR